MTHGAAALAGLLVLSTMACDESLVTPSAAALSTASLWKLQSLVRDGVEAVAPDPDRFTLQFTADGRVSALADCNRCNGSYAIAGDHLAISTLACTRAFCQTAPFDAQYVNLLNGDSAVRLHGAVLHLSSARGTLRFAR